MTGAHQGGAGVTGAHQGGGDRAEDLHGGTDGPEDHGRDWDLGNTETHETDRASMAENTKKSSINSGLIIGGFKGSKPASVAVTRQDESSGTALSAGPERSKGSLTASIAVTGQGKSSQTASLAVTGQGESSQT